MGKSDYGNFIEPGHILFFLILMECLSFFFSALFNVQFIWMSGLSYKFHGWMDGWIDESMSDDILKANNLESFLKIIRNMVTKIWLLK